MVKQQRRCHANYFLSWFKKMNQKKSRRLDQETMRMSNPPPPRALTKLRWTLTRARTTPWVTWREGIPYVGSRLLVLPQHVEEVVAREFDVLSPREKRRLGYLQWYDRVASKYVGIRRMTLRLFLKRHRGEQQRDEPLR